MTPLAQSRKGCVFNGFFYLGKQQMNTLPATHPSATSSPVLKLPLRNVLVRREKKRREKARSIFIGWLICFPTMLWMTPPSFYPESTPHSAPPHPIPTLCFMLPYIDRQTTVRESGHEGDITCLQVCTGRGSSGNEDGAVIVTASEGGAVRVWDVAHRSRS